MSNPLFFEQFMAKDLSVHSTEALIHLRMACESVIRSNALIADGYEQCGKLTAERQDELTGMSEKAQAVADRISQELETRPQSKAWSAGHEDGKRAIERAKPGHAPTPSRSARQKWASEGAWFDYVQGFGTALREKREKDVRWS
jgi:hypothetical protein